MRSYAAVWSDADAIDSGRLDVHADRLELHGRERRLIVGFAQLASLSIARHREERLRGLPVLVLRGSNGADIRIASLEGAGVLQEVSHAAERAGLTPAA